MHEDFDEAVFDPVGSDVHDVFWPAVDRFGGAARRVADYGCGTGRQLPRLARDFDEVVGYDFAPKLLQVAQERVRGLENVRVARADLRKRFGARGRFDLGVCVNACIMPSHDDRSAVLQHIRATLAPGAHLILVIPSLEAALYANTQLIEWNRRSGLRGRALFREGLATTSKATNDLLHGVIDLDGSRTKHFLREEALSILATARFEVMHEARVEYPWRAYFDHPPRWLRPPGPWDWMFVARRC